MAFMANSPDLQPSPCLRAEVLPLVRVPASPLPPWKQPLPRVYQQPGIGWPQAGGHPHFGCGCLLQKMMNTNSKMPRNAAHYSWAALGDLLPLALCYISHIGGGECPVNFRLV